jgi:hypothetical protein
MYYTDDDHNPRTLRSSSQGEARHRWVARDLRSGVHKTTETAHTSYVNSQFK